MQMLLPQPVLVHRQDPCSGVHGWLHQGWVVPVNPSDVQATLNRPHANFAALNAAPSYQTRCVAAFEQRGIALETQLGAVPQHVRYDSL